jgi:DNA-binding transcriptional LysR family regulator
VTIELSVDEGLTDIVAGNFDAGGRLGESVERDMIAVRIGPEIRSAVVGSPAYCASRPRPSTPHDLAQHNCISYRQTASGGLYAWEFEKGGRDVSVRVAGSLVFNDADLMVMAALDGRGLAHALEGQVAEQIASGRLIRVLEDWCPIPRVLPLLSRPTADAASPGRTDPSAALSSLSLPRRASRFSPAASARNSAEGCGTNSA